MISTLWKSNGWRYSETVFFHPIAKKINGYFPILEVKNTFTPPYRCRGLKKIPKLALVQFPRFSKIYLLYLIRFFLERGGSFKKITWLFIYFRYLYLIFSGDDLLSLDEFVFNTEAHPLKIRSWNKGF